MSRLIQACRVLILLLAAGTLQAQGSEAARIRVAVAEDFSVGDTVRMVVTVQPRSGWHVYSGQPSEEGVYMPADLGYEHTSRGFSADSTLFEAGDLRSKFDDILGGTIRYYESETEFFHNITIREPEVIIVGYFDYMACNDFKCIPFTEEFRLELKARDKETD